MLKTLLKFRNIDSTLDLNTQLSEFFKKGIVSGGEVNPVVSQLRVTINPFKLIGSDGMVVLETSDTATLEVVAGQTNVICFKSQYVPNNEPIVGFESVELSTFLARADLPYLTVFAFVTLAAGATQVVASDISYLNRDQIDPVGRLVIRGTFANATLLPTQNNRPGDSYLVTSGSGDTPSIYSWNGLDWLNITDSITIASTLNAHRNNLFANEIHLTEQQAYAAQGTYATPGVEPIGVTFDLGTSLATLANPLSNNSLVTEKQVTFSSTGLLPTGIVAGVIYFVIKVTDTTFRIATTAANAASNIAITLTGVQTGVHTAVFNENKYVTSMDPRIPNFDEIAALVGFPNTPIPSATNPFVTASYVLAEPSELPVTGAGPYQLSTALGPFYVGTGGVGTAVNYFKVYLANFDREYVNPLTGIPVTVTGVYKDLALTQPLVPSTEPSIIANNGFYSNALYITTSGTIPGAYPGVLYYGKQRTLAEIDRAAYLKPNINSAQTNAEVLTRLQSISGRVFDDPVPADETNKELRVDLNDITTYGVATTAANLVINSQEIPRLSEYDPTTFAVDRDESVLVPGGTQFAALYEAPNYSRFGVSADLAMTAVIEYNIASLPAVTTANVGSLFIDGAGTAFRIIAPGVNSPKPSVLIYTGGAIVNLTNTPQSGRIISGNNPRQIMLNDHSTFLGREVIHINQLKVVPGQAEILPPGGCATFGTTKIGTSILAANGSATGVSSGRNLYYVLPKASNNWYDERIVLIGGWQTSSNKQYVLGQVSNESLGIEYTGYVNQLSLLTIRDAASSYNLEVFVDGVYFNTYAGADPSLSSATSLFFEDGETPLQKLVLPLNLSTDVIHTVRIEVTVQAGGFVLGGMEIYTSSALKIKNGNEFLNTTLNQLDATSDADVLQQAGSNLALKFFGAKTLKYVDGNTSSPTYKNYTYANETFPYYSFKLLAGQLDAPTGVLSSAPSAMQLGDVVLINQNSAFSNTPNEQICLVKAGIPGGGAATKVLTTPITIPTGMDSALEYLFRIPVSTDGTVKLNAPYSKYSSEYARFLVSDWDNGNSNSVAKSTVDLEGNKVTVLADQVTSLLMKQCTLVETNLEGYKQGISLSSASSEMVFQLWGTRADVVFSGNQGACTVQIEIDGRFSYQLALSGTGVEKHTIFYDASPQSHVVRIHSPSVAGKAVVSEWIFSDFKMPSYQGVPLTSYTIARQFNALLPNLDPVISEGSQQREIAPTSLTGALVTSESGNVVYDVTKSAILNDGTGGVNWALVEDFAVNSRFGYYLSSSNQNATFSHPFTGKSFELYIQDATEGVAGNIIQFSLEQNGVLKPLNQLNFPNLNALPAGSSNGQFDISSGQFKKAASGNVMRIAVTGLPYGSYVLKVQNLAPSEIRILALAENAGTYQIQKRNKEDTKSKWLRLSSSLDERVFATLLPQQGGGGFGTLTEEDITVQAVSNPVDIPAFTPASGYGAMMSNSFLNSPAADPQIEISMSTAGWDSANNAYSFKAEQNVQVSSVGTNFTLLATPTFNLKPGDIIYHYASNEWRAIATIAGLNGTIDASFTTNLVAAPCMLSQALWTKDLTYVGDAGVSRAYEFFDAGTKVKSISISYLDGTPPLTEAGLIAPADVVVSASNSGIPGFPGNPLSSGYSPIFTRGMKNGMIEDYALTTNPSEERLFLTFFVNPNSVLASATLFRYDCSFYQLDTIANGGILDSAYAYNDGSQTPVNSSNPVNVSNRTEWSLNFNYIMGVNPGVDGDLTVQVNGQTVHRYVAGSMPSSELYYEEITPSKIRFSKDIITGYPTLALSAKRLQGINDQSIVNNLKLNQILSLTVGTAAQVAEGVATHTSLQTAINASVAGGKITVLGGVSSTENIILNKRILIVGEGYDSYINGTFTLNGSDFSTLKNIRVNQFIVSAGSDGNIIENCFWATNPTDSGTGNIIVGVNIT